MRFWFDTEFCEDGRTIELISIGVVAEDGRTYYTETSTAAWLASRTEWLQRNVAPHLNGPRKSRAIIAKELVEFMGDKPEIWAYYADYDWVVLCQLFGTMIDLPAGWPMYCRDVKQLADDLGNLKLPDQTTAEHNALADAVWTAEAWRFLKSVTDAAAPEMLDALIKLSNEVFGSLPLIELQARQDMGNTNYHILIQRAEESRAIIAKCGR